MHITGTHFSYFQVCRRKLWLFANNIQMEHTSDLVYEGKLIHETSYPQRNSNFEEVEIGGVKIDFFDPKKQVIHEVKKSDKKEDSHEWQLKYYIYVLENHGFEGVSGILEYPKLRKTTEVFLSDVDRAEIETMKMEISELIENPACPARIDRKMCKNCSYFDFCYVDEI